MVLGLRHIHECDLVHLDVKPENFFFTSAGTLKIGDFGISKERNHTSAFENADLLQPSVSTSWDSATMAAALNRSNRSASDPVAPVKSKDTPQPSGESEAGDAAYMAPELISRELGPVGQPADLFSLGAVLLELAADIDLPYREAGWMHLRHLHGQPPTAKAGALHGDLLTVNASDGARTQCHTDGSSIMSEGARLQYEGRSSELRSLIQRLLHRIPSARPTIDEVMAEPKLQSHLQRRQQTNSQSFLRDYLGLVPIRLQPAPAPIAAPSTQADDQSYSSPPSSPVSQRSVAPAAAFSVRSSDGHETDTHRRQHSSFRRDGMGAAHRAGNRASDSDDDETQSKTVVSLFSSPIASPSREPADAVMSFDAPLGISVRSNPRSMEPSNVLSNFDSDSDDDEHLDDLEGSRQRRRLSSAFRQQDNGQASNMISGGDTVFRVSNSMEDIGYNEPARPLPAASAFVVNSKPHVISESPVGVSPAYQRNWSRGTTPVFAMDPTGVFAVPAPRVVPHPAHSVHAPVHSAESGFSSLALSPTVPLTIAPGATQSPAPSVSRSTDKLSTPVQARASPANPFYTAQSTPFRPPTTVSTSTLTPSHHSVGAFAQTPLGFSASNIVSPTPVFNTAQPPLLSLAQQVQQHQMRRPPSVPFSPRESAPPVDRESAPSPSFAFTPSAALFSAKPRTSSPADPKPNAE
jgi:serine/threonine protein kinase